MNSIYKLIIFFLFSIISYTQCVDLIISERTFLLDLAQKVNDTKLNIIGLESMICVNITGCGCDNNGYLTRLSITSSSENAINWNDLNGFSKLESLSINRAYIDDVNFIFNPIPTISYLVIYTFSSLSFDQPFPNYYSFECNLIIHNYPIINLKISNFANVKEFTLLNEINIEYDGVDLSSNNLRYLTMVSSNVPNVTSLSKLIYLKYTISQNYFNESSFSNILSLNKLQTIDLYFQSSISYDFPVEFSLMENPQWYSMNMYYGNWKTPSQYIDFSNHKRSDVLMFIYFSGPNFNINGSIPFSNLPGNTCSMFGMIFGYYTKLPDMKLFESCRGISLQNLGIGGNLPSVKDTLQKSKLTSRVSLNNNFLTGTIDESWCSIGLDISNNSLTGKLPDCKYCYQNDPMYQSFYSLNKFTNYNTNATCTYEQISVYKIIVNDIGVVLIGKNIGFNLANIETYPKIVFQTNNLNDSFSGFFLNGNNGSYDIIQVRFLVPGINFTISLKNSPPIANAGSFGTDTIFIFGEYFSYDKSGISVEIYNGRENLNCIVVYSTFDKIICKINVPVFVYGVISKGNLKVNGYNTTFPISLLNTTIINGYCDDLTKSCYCYSKWTRLNQYSPCTIPNHYLSSSSIVQSNIGGDITLSGWFGDVHDDPIVLLNNKPVKIELIDNETIVITIPPGVGSRSIEIIQNNITWSGSIYPYSESTIKCLNNCSGNGNCNSNGECKCNDNYIGLDCSTNKDSGSPPTHVIINPNGTTTITNEDTVYLIYINSISEIDLNNNQVPNSLINLKNGWKFDNNTSNSSITNFYQNINNVLIIMTIENIESNNGKEFTFAGNQFTVSKDGFKLSLSVSSWNYKSNLNTLQIQMSSDISTNESDKINNCIYNEHTNVETSSNSNNLQNVNYLKISKNGKTLYGRFQDKMLSDGRSTTTITKIISKDDKKVLISLDMPHCNQCLLDPDFSVIINSDFKPSDSCDKENKKSWLIPVAVTVPVVGYFSVIINSDFKSSDSCGKENKKSWLIPVAVTVPVVGCALIIAAFMLGKKIRDNKKLLNKFGGK
ncbi:hypothetical protein ACTFIY_009266 [Dictyostelium cf. discoideum]